MNHQLPLPHLVPASPSPGPPVPLGSEMWAQGSWQLDDGHSA